MKKKKGYDRKNVYSKQCGGAGIRALSPTWEEEKKKKVVSHKKKREREKNISTLTQKRETYEKKEKKVCLIWL